MFENYDNGGCGGCGRGKSQAIENYSEIVTITDQPLVFETMYDILQSSEYTPHFTDEESTSIPTNIF